MASAGTAYIDFQGRFDDLLDDARRMGQRAADNIVSSFGASNIGRDIGADLTRGLQGAMGDARNIGANASRDLAAGLNGRGLGAAAGADVGAGLDAGLDGLRRAGARAGDQFGDGFEQAADRSVKGAASKIAGAAAGIFAGMGVFSLATTAFEEAREAAQVGRLTDAVIESTGMAAHLAAEQIADLSSELSRKAGVDDEVIQSGANLLLTFTKVRDEVGAGNDIFSQATGLALDMSAAMGTEMRGAAMQLGKALNDPIKGMSTLGRAGVQFSADQKEQIRTMVEAGDILGAQKMILGELETQFGGAAEAASDPIAKLQVAWGNLLEDVGARILPWASETADAIGEWLPGAFDRGTAAVEGFVEKAKEIGSDLWGRVRPAVEDLQDALGNVVDAGEDLWDTLQPVGETLLMIGGSAVIGALTVAADLIERVTGFIADHTDVVMAAVVAYGAWRVALLAPAVWAGVAKAVLWLSASFDKVAISAYNALGPVSTLTLAAGGFAAIAGTAFFAWQEIQSAGEATKQWRQDVEADLDLRSFKDLKTAISDGREEFERAAAEAERLGIRGGSFFDRYKAGAKGVFELFTPLENDIMGAAQSTRGAAEATEEWERQMFALKEKYVDVADVLNTTDLGSVEKWVIALDLNPAAMSATQLAEAIREGKKVADEGVPTTEALAGAIGVLGDETSGAADELGAFKDVLDSIIGVQVSFEEAQIGFAQSIIELSGAATEAANAGEAWSTNLFGGDLASLQTRETIAGLVTEATNMAVAFYEAGGGIEGATYKLAEARNQIITAGEAAGISQADMEAYLAVLELTPENITTAIQAQVDMGSMDAAEYALAIQARNRTVSLVAQLDPVARANAERYIAQATADRTVTVRIELDPVSKATADRYIAQAEAQWNRSGVGSKVMPGKSVAGDLFKGMGPRRAAIPAAAFTRAGARADLPPINLHAEIVSVIDGKQVGRNRHVFEGIDQQGKHPAARQR
jgi:hypothetical protein